MYNEALREFGILPEDEASISSEHTSAVGGGHTIVINTPDGVKIIMDPLGRPVDRSIRAKNWHEPFVRPANTDTPRARYNSDGTVAEAGWLPSGQYAELDGRLWFPGDKAKNVNDAVNDLITAVLASVEG